MRYRILIVKVDFTAGDLEEFKSNLAYLDKEYNKVIIALAAHGNERNQIEDANGELYDLQRLYNGLGDDPKLQKFLLMSCCRKGLPNQP